ncbi:MAG: DUF2218 domain-containing protein [Chloroflexota bacterium]
MITEVLPEDVVAGAITHMNEDHQHNLLDYAHKFGKCDWAQAAEMTALDGGGFDLMITGEGREEIKRIPFPKPVSNRKELRETLVQMAMEASPTSSNASTEASAVVQTKKAFRYMKTLCIHFDHKADATFNDTSGHVKFAFGECDFQVTDSALHIDLKAESGDLLERTKYVVGDHLVRFAKKDNLTVDWVDK